MFRRESPLLQQKQSILVRIYISAVNLDHAKREIVRARFYEIPAEALEQAAK